MEIGSVVYSKSGHDKDEAYLVIGVEEKSGYLVLVDGSRRPMENPKRKNPKHLKDLGEKIPEAIEKHKEKKLMDSDLVWYLKPYRK